MNEVGNQPKVDTKKSIDEGFASFMDKQETKLLLSMVPPSENQETLPTLLKSAFQSGHSAGIGMIMTEMLTAMLSGPRREGPRF